MGEETRRLAIIGAGGHGKVAADIAALNGYGEIVFLDDDGALRHCGRYPVVGKSTEASRMGWPLFVAIGNPETRSRIMGRVGHTVTLIHPRAVIAEGVVIGEGTVVMAGAVINPGTVIGKGAIINTCSSVDHDCLIGEFVHVAVGAHIAGNVTGHGSVRVPPCPTTCVSAGMWSSGQVPLL